MTRRILIVIATLIVLIPATSRAAEFGLGLRAGTQGLGAEGAVSFTQWVSLRAGVHGGDLSYDFDEGGINYDGELQLGGYGVLVDFFPMRGTFRLTGGLFSNANEVEIRVRATEDIEIGGTLYSPAEAGTLSGTVDWNSTAPYLGIGWGNVARGKRVGFLCDLGVLSQGSGEVTLVSDSPFVDPADLAREAAEIEDDIDGFKLWPVVSFGLAIRF